MTFMAGFVLGAIIGGLFGAMIIMLFTSGKISDLQDKIDSLEGKADPNWRWSDQERVL